MALRDVVVVGASAGGVEALKAFAQRLPLQFPAAILVVLHVPAGTSVLPMILARSGKLSATHASDGAPLTPGNIYIAPPDRHLVVHAGRMRLTSGPRVNNHRPAIDALFMSAARWLGPRVASVILSGVLDDGSSGTLAVRLAGGTTIAQDPAEALYPAMPQNAIDHAGVDHVLTIEKIVERLVAIAGTPVEGSKAPGPLPMEDIEHEIEIDPEGSANVGGPASGFTCPECKGALWELEHGALVRYRCRVGHSYGPETLVATQSEKLEEALWAAYRALEEAASLSKRFGERASSRGLALLARRYQERHDQAVERAKTIRHVLERGLLAESAAADDK